MQKTPSKSDDSVGADSEKTPEKACLSSTPPNKNSSTFLKDTEKPNSCVFRTPEKTKNTVPVNGSPEKSDDFKTPEKKVENFDLRSEQAITCDGDDEMISTTEQARLLIAASKTPSKSLNKTPAKQNTPSGKRSIESSPVTPGKYRRVELITLASPKTKRIKQL